MGGTKFQRDDRLLGGSSPEIMTNHSLKLTPLYCEKISFKQTSRDLKTRPQNRGFLVHFFMDKVSRMDEKTGTFPLKLNCKHAGFFLTNEGI